MIEEDPYLNFVALLKSYKVLGRILSGTLHEFYRDRNKIYFKNFFMEKELYEIVKKDIVSLYPKYKDVKVTITKRGVIIYDNYKPSTFNVLLLTIHSGTWIPRSIGKKMSINKQDRLKEEDLFTDRIYRSLVLDKGGIWIDNKQSRFAIDFNRKLDNAIYADNSEKWLDVLWKEKLTKRESDELYQSYKEFYFTLTRLLDSYQFNIIFDGHSMKHLPGRPEISFGTRYIPKFYMPIVKGMQRKMRSLDYSPVYLDKPFKGGNILRWMSTMFPHVFIFSMEVNKNLYMTKNRLKIVNKRLNRVSEDIKKIFDIELEDE
jgi:N-formylglutamate amidohydrolase